MSEKKADKNEDKKDMEETENTRGKAGKEEAEENTAHQQKKENAKGGGGSPDCRDTCRVVPDKFDPIDKRIAAALKVRKDSAKRLSELPVPENTDDDPLCNCDEADYRNTEFSFPASYSKGLRHDRETGEVISGSYEKLLEALAHSPMKNGDAVAEFERIIKDELGDCPPAAEKFEGAGDAGGNATFTVQQVPQALPQPDSNNFPLVNPLAAQAFDLIGADSHALKIFDWENSSSGQVDLIPFPKPPKFNSPDEIAEMAEVYWMALARDVLFNQYEKQAADPDSIIAKAINNLNKFEYFQKLFPDGVNAGNLFRGNLTGDDTGPFLSQYLARPVPYAAFIIDPRIRTVRKVEPDDSGEATGGGLDYVIYFDENHPSNNDYGSWLDVQNGCLQPGDLFDPNISLIRSGRDLGQYVHVDSLFEQYVNACQILQVPVARDAPVPSGLTVPQGTDSETGKKTNLLGGGFFPPRFAKLLAAGNPYRESKTQQGFGTLGIPDVKVLIAEAAKHALKAAWYQKWSVHRRLRPEEFGGRIEAKLNRGRDYDFDAGAFALLEKEVLPLVQKHNENFKCKSNLLPMAFPEGSPTHPAYPQGHATVAGACITVLKAFFNDNPLTENGVVIVEAAGRNKLVKYEKNDAKELSVHGELNKLASNVGLGRDFAGVHWRTDYSMGLRLGEAVAVRMLQDVQATYFEKVSFSFKPFYGKGMVEINMNGDVSFIT